MFARIVLLIAGLALLANAAWLAVTANLTLGTALVAVFGLGFLIWAIRFRRARWWSHTLAAAITLAFIGASAFLAWSGLQDNATGHEDAIIVLGAAVHHTEPSSTLVGRLDAALAEHKRNPEALMVVTGGQGFQEDIPEATAERDYLISHGVDASDIVVDDASTSTTENLANARTLLDRKLKPGYKVTFVTDEFHVYRAGLIAASLGLDATHVAARTPWYFWTADYAREVVAVAGQWLGASSS